MSRTFEAAPILAALIEEYHAGGHFIFNKDGNIYARLIATEDEHGEIPFHGRIDFCLTTLAATIAERLSR